MNTKPLRTREVTCAENLLAGYSPWACWLPTSCRAQEKDDIRELKLRDWKPRSMLVTKVTEVSKPAFPVIDVHNHLGGGKATLTPERVKHYIDGDGRGRRPHGGQPRRRLGAETQRDPGRA